MLWTKVTLALEGLMAQLALQCVLIVYITFAMCFIEGDTLSYDLHFICKGKV